MDVRAHRGHVAHRQRPRGSHPRFLPHSLHPHPGALVAGDLAVLDASAGPDPRLRLRDGFPGQDCTGQDAHCRGPAPTRHAVHESLFTSRQRLLQHGPHVLPPILIQVVPARIVKVPSCLRANLCLNQDCAFGPYPSHGNWNPPRISVHLAHPSTIAGDLPQRPRE